MDVGYNESESVEDLFKEIWERESQAELHFEVNGVGKVVLTQDLFEERWKVSNFSNTVWEAAIWMHHFFQDERFFPVGWLRGRRVLELGAGTGLVGLTLALIGAEVTMTDLPEALPILRHNTNATFGCSSKSNGAICESADGSMTTGESPRGSRSQLVEEGAKMPTIQQLRWGSSEDAEGVAAGEASAATVEAGCQPPEWRGFDLVVGADIIYNESTFPLLVETLSDRRLCSDRTIVYLATMLRGGRHEELLNQLGRTFQVRALEPYCADKLRTQVACGEDWAGPEWRPTEIYRQKKTNSSAPKGSGEIGDRREHTAKVDSGAGSIICKGLDIPRREDGERSPSPSVETAATVGVGLDGREKLSGVKTSKTKGNYHTCGWGYEVDGLGKMLAFAARRRPNDWCGLEESTD